MKFIRNHKKLTICLFVLLLLVLAIVILAFTLFSLKESSLEFKTETKNLNQETKNKIVERVLENKRSVLFLNKTRISADLEKQFPYLKIINIETKIPNKVVVHCAEREEFFAISSNGKTYFMDEELKILRIVNAPYESEIGAPVLLVYKGVKVDETSSSTISQTTLDLNLDSAEEGAFLDFGQVKDETDFSKEIKEVSTSILTGFEENNRTISDVLNEFLKFEICFEPITLGGISELKLCLALTDKNGFVTKIIDANENLSLKLGTMFEAFSDVSKDPKLLEKDLFVFQNSSGQFAYLFK